MHPILIDCTHTQAARSQDGAGASHNTPLTLRRGTKAMTEPSTSAGSAVPENANDGACMH